MKYDLVISGLGPSEYGVGRLLKQLQLTAEKNEVKCLFRYTHLSEYKRAKADKNWKRTFIELTKLIQGLISFHLTVWTTKKKQVLLIHPQSIGLRTTERLIENNNVSMYVMDSFFFCIKSYNYRDGKECIECVGGISEIARDCAPYPSHLSQSSSFKFLENLQRYKSGIKFIAQNKNQEKLLRLHFGGDIITKVVPIYTGEISSERESPKDSRKPYVVFHGGNFLAKGIMYFIELARECPDIQFIVPSAKSEVLKITQTDQFPDNVRFSPCTWESGLKELVIKSSITFCPSHWSAPIEGALLKSIAYAKAVAVVETMYSFSNEIPNHCLIRLPTDPKAAGKIVLGTVSDDVNLHAKSNIWLNQFLETSKKTTEDLFFSTKPKNVQ